VGALVAAANIVHHPDHLLHAAGSDSNRAQVVQAVLLAALKMVGGLLEVRRRRME
jgi:hypothetical protein